MSRHPLEAIQSGRTEYWEEIRDKHIDEYGQILDTMRFWRPIDTFMKRRQLQKLQKFLVRATTIIEESHDVDREIAIFHEQENALPHLRLVEIIPEPFEETHSSENIS